jgi:hypothetical protein
LGQEAQKTFQGANILATQEWQKNGTQASLDTVQGPNQELAFDRGRPPKLPRKEVIQPQLPLQLPCYDFVPVTSPTLDGCFLAVSPPASGVTSSHDVTGGVYKARERIQRSMADLRLLATPTSWRRVAASNPN